MNRELFDHVSLTARVIDLDRLARVNDRRAQMCRPPLSTSSGVGQVHHFATLLVIAAVLMLAAYRFGDTAPPAEPAPPAAPASVHPTTLTC